MIKSSAYCCSRNWVDAEAEADAGVGFCERFFRHLPPIFSLPL